MTLTIEETPFLELILLNPINPIRRLTQFYIQLFPLIIPIIVPLKNMTLTIEELQVLELIPLNPLNPIKGLTQL